MTQKHTPGPWTYRFRSGGTTIEPENDDRVLAVVRITRDVGDADANAKLIAAAPELLAACRNALDALYLMGDDESHLAYRQAAVKELEAALAKATSPQAR